MAKVISQLPSGGSVPKHNNLLGLNEGDYLHLTQSEKAKLDGIQSGAEVNVNADWNAVSGDAQLLNKPSTFPPSAHTHTISEITDFPTIQTIDNIPTDGSNNAVSSNGVFDALATKAPISSVHNPVSLGTANGLSLSNQQLSLGLASSGVTGALSDTDWNTFNGKFNTPTGLTANNLPKWNGSGFGNSQIVDNGTTVKIGSARPSFSEGISISKNITTTNRHSFEDYSIINSSIPNFGFGVFDASTEMAGNLSNDHFNAFQSRLIYSSSANLLDTDISRSMCSFLSRNIITGSGGMKYSIGIRLDNLRVTGTGIVENLYGLYVEPQTKGTVSNFDIYSQGRSNNFGTISINTLNKDTSLNVNGQDDTYIISSFKGGSVLSGKKYSGITIGKEFATDGETGLLGYYTNQSNNLLSGIYLANYGDSEINKSIFLQRGGKVFIGANSDNASGALMQVNGTISASPATTANQVPTWGQVQAAARPYKVYTALLTQTGTNAPTATVLENTLGGTVVWTRFGTGVYKATLSNAFTSNKTFLLTGLRASAGATYSTILTLSPNTASNVQLMTSLSDAARSLSDGLLTGDSIEIRVYN